MQLVAWILAGPAAAFVGLGLLPPLRRRGRLAGYASIAGIAVSLGAALLLALRYRSDPTPASWEFVWAPLSTLPAFRFGVLVDGLSVAMLVVVALVALAVQVYSLGYMSHETPGGLGRYFTWHSLFALAMLGLVASHNTLQTYVFWELVGLGSYLLIGFWYRRPEAARAALKAFWTTRLGDVGFAVGVVLLASAGGTFVFAELFQAADRGTLAGPLLVAGVAGLYLGAMGKSAQFPLHIWLPDAMEGPTPVSALIHAATMVAAGVYLMVRTAPLLARTPQVAAWVLGIGVLTALLAASMALVARDVKRVLAYSTVSQLGMMMAAVGAGAAGAALFHLTTHAFFKALLFLAAGSLIHAVGSNDLFAMGRLARRMPWTCGLFAVGTLALAGAWPLSGFFSKDEILLELWQRHHPWAFAALLLTAGLTAFYMFRAFFLAFFGHREAPAAHESGALLLGPMVPLALLAAAGGVCGPALAAAFEHSISFASAATPTHGGGAVVPLVALLSAATGAVLAWAGYQARVYRPEAVRSALAPLVRLVERGYFVDDVFAGAFRVLYLGVGAAIGWIDRYVVDGVVNFVTWLAWRAATRLRAVHTGRAQDALYAVAIGLLVLALLAARS